MLTSSKAVEHSAGRDDHRQRAQYQRNDELDVGVDGRVGRHEAIDVEGRHRRRAVRLLRLDLVLGDRRAGVVVRPDAHLVTRARLQLVQRVRLLYLLGICIAE